MAPNVFKGDFKGNTLLMGCVDGQGHSRTTWELRDASHYFFRMEMSSNGQQWMTLMEGDYTREAWPEAPLLRRCLSRSQAHLPQRGNGY